MKEVKNELAILGNRADQMEQKIADIKDRNLEMKTHEERDLRVPRNGKTL